MKFTLQFSPVYQRESRVLWRNDRPFVLLMIHAVALGLAALSAYAGSGMADTDLIGHKLDVGGRAMFQAISAMQLGILLLVVPILAAPAIAAERERGLLEALHLSGLTPRSIVGGKLGGVLVFALMLLLASAPPLSICFLMGGVAPDEFLKVMVLQGLTILTGAALGLYLSSRARRPPQALRNVVIALALWLGTGYFGTSRGFSIGYDSDWEQALAEICREICNQLSVFNPLLVLQATLSPASRPTFGPFGPPLLSLPLHIVFQLGAAFLLLSRAQANTARTFASAQWMERKKYLTLHDGHFAWRDAAAVKPVAVTNPAAQRVSGRPSLDTPLASLIKFKNPVLQREVRSLLRMRRFPDPVMALLGVAGVGALLLVVWMLLWVWIEPNARGTFWNTGARLALLASTTLMPLAGAAGIARERENGSWEGLRLSLLTPRQIVWGKALAPLLVLGGVIAALTPIWLPCINWLTLTAEPIGHGAPILNALAMLALIFCTAFNYTAWGLWISWRARSTAAATGWTMGTLFFFVVALPTVMQIGLTILFTLFIGVDYQFGQNIGDPISLYLINRALNPWSAAQGLLATPSNYWTPYYGAASPYSADPQLTVLPIVLATVLSTVVGALLLFDVERRMGKSSDGAKKAPSKMA